MKINSEILQRPWGIFTGYVVIASLVIMVFRLVFPGEPPPLPIFSQNWRLVRGFLDVIALFPALAFSALVIPFGRGSDDEVRYQSFSPQLFQRLLSSIVAVICAAGVYALLCFILFPLMRNAEANMRFTGEKYRIAKEQAQAHAAAGEWFEALQFIGICNSVWEDSPDLEKLRKEAEIRLNEMRVRALRARAETGRFPAGESDTSPRSASISALPGQKDPMNATEAIALAQDAFNKGKFFDAHWYATLGGRIAGEGSPENTEATRLAALAWNQVESQRPGDRETTAYSIYQEKASGYQAVLTGDWIRAYYIFRDLYEQVPRDPDTENYLALSEKGLTEIAFFIDEDELSVGRTLTGVVFSLPWSPDGSDRQGTLGRSVLRVAGFSAAPDYAYGIGLEYMVFDSLSRPLLSLQSQYAKFLPVTLEGKHRVLVLMRALDRNDSDVRREPVWTAQDETVYQPGQAQVVLNVSYDTFLKLSQMRQGLSGLHLWELFDASRIAGEHGYISQVFEAEILNRLGSCLFFLPMAIFILIIGLHLRAQSRPRYFFTIMLPVLPVVFNGLTYLYRTVLNTVGVSLILAVGFSSALILYIVILAVSFILSLVILAAYRS